MNLLLISELREEPAPPAFGGEFQAHIASKCNPVVRRASLTAWSLLAQGLALICPKVAAQNPAQHVFHDISAAYKTPCLQRSRECICPCAEAAVWAEAESSAASQGGDGSTAVIYHSSPSGSDVPACIQHDDGRLPFSLPAVGFGPQGKPGFLDCPLHFSLAHSGSFAVALLSCAPCGVDIERVRGDVAGRLYARVLTAEEQRLGLDFFECWTQKECIGKLSGLGVDAHPSKLDTMDERWASRFHCERFLDSLGQAYILSALCEDDSPLCTLRLP